MIFCQELLEQDLQIVIYNFYAK